MQIEVGSTSRSVDVLVTDDVGLPATGLVASTFPTVTWSRAGANPDGTFAALSDLAELTTDWIEGGLKERAGGKYRLDVPDAMFSAAGNVTITGEATDKHVIVPVIEVGTWSAAAIAAGLGTPVTVIYSNPLRPGNRHFFTRGGAYTANLGNAPSQLIAKADFPGLSLLSTIKFRLEVLTQPEADAINVEVTGSITSYDATRWKVTADVSSANTAELPEGVGKSQFWAEDSDGTNDQELVTYKLTMERGIDVPAPA